MRLVLHLLSKSVICVSSQVELLSGGEPLVSAPTAAYVPFENVLKYD